MASHYLNQWWLVYWRIYASLGLNELLAEAQMPILCYRLCVGKSATKLSHVKTHNSRSRYIHWLLTVTEAAKLDILARFSLGYSVRNMDFPSWVDVQKYLSVLWICGPGPWGFSGSVLVYQRLLFIATFIIALALSCYFSYLYGKLSMSILCKSCWTKGYITTLLSSVCI